MEPDRTSARQRIREQADRQLTKTESLLSSFAQTSGGAVRRFNRKEPDVRSAYSRDADRILNSKAYTRYIDKTQVFYLVQNDHITHRVLHVQLVSKIARTIGRVLRLNEDLIEAIALGHDIGHAPYGHIGEQCLSGLCRDQGIGRFFHNAQSVAFLDRIEDQDLTLQVLDGILCHNGESGDTVLVPDFCGGFEAFDRRRERVAAGEDPHPMTLEGCVVRIADTIAYIGRDLEDAREVGLIRGNDEEDWQWTGVLGTDNRTIVDTLIWDLLVNSDSEGSPHIRFSDEVSGALADLRRFSTQNIYENPKLTAERVKIERMYRTLFETYLDDVLRENTDSRIFKEFIGQDWVSPRYRKDARPAEMVRDYIAGMTDRYFEKRFEENTMPRKIEGAFPLT
ncbi:MAG: HD domain-containing protein [Methanomicrobiaceae archaeon]|nr:HD domain-containing protein [Methanomicrobiaceae archaeon]